jgi:anti-sigma B factor antagonist
VSPQQPQLAVVTLPGEIDASNDGQVLDTLTSALDGGTAVLVADAGRTTFCGCSGVTALIRTHHQAAAAGAQLRVVAASRAMRRILELTGADQVLDTYPTRAAALADGQAPDRS